MVAIMEHCHVIASFQGAILSADHVNPLPSLTTKEGNETKVLYVIQSLRKFLMEEGYIDETGLVKERIPKMRKLAMYIVLNSDLTEINSMLNVNELEPVLYTIPSIPTYLMCEMFWQLHMETFLYEMIPKCVPRLGINIAEAFLEKFQYFRPTICLNQLENISAACYALICRINCYKLEDDMELNTILNTVYETFLGFTKYYTEPPNCHLLEELSTDELYKYKGQCFKSLLNLVHSCLNMYMQDTDPNSDDPIYKLTYKSAALKNTTCKIYNTPCQLLLAFVENANHHLLDILEKIVMDINVDIFCAWSEFEEEGKTMQQFIGELCHKVLVKIRSVENLANHSVLSMIKLMARQPVDIKDIINEMDAIAILSKINTSEQEAVDFIRALVHRKNLVRDLELVSVVYSYINIYNAEECCQLFKAFENVAIETTNPKNRKLLLSTKIKLFRECKLLDKHTIMKEHFKEKTFINVNMEQDFDSSLNIMFNKYIGESDVELTDVFTLFYQNPRKVYTKIFGLATQNAKLIEPMLKVMQLLHDYSEYCYSTETEPCIITVMKFILNKCSDNDYDCNIINFICELNKHCIISNSQLLMLVIMPTLHESLLAKDVENINVQINLLTKAFPVEDLLPYRPPLLVMMVQIMEYLRLKNHVTLRLFTMQVLQKIINFVKSIVTSYFSTSKVVTASEEKWLREKLQELKLHVLNFYYLKPLWQRNDKCFFELITNIKVHDVSLCMITLKIAVVISYITLEEWFEIYDNLIENQILPMDAIRLFHSAVNLVTVKIGTSTRAQNRMSNLLYVYTNLVQIIRRKFLIEPLSNERVTTCCTLLAINLKMTDERDVNTIATVVMPLFAYLAERNNDYKVDVPEYFEGTKYLHIVQRYIPSQCVKNA